MEQLGIVKVVETKTTVYQVKAVKTATGEQLKDAVYNLRNEENRVMEGFEVTTITETFTDSKYHLDYQLIKDRPSNQKASDKHYDFR